MVARQLIRLIYKVRRATLPPVALNPKKLKVLELIYNYPQSINSIPYDAKNRGFEILSVEQDGPTIRFIIKHL